MNMEDLPYTTLLASGAMKDGVNVSVMKISYVNLVCVLYSSMSKNDVYHTSSRPNKVQLLDGAIVKPCHLFIRPNTYSFVCLHRRFLIVSSGSLQETSMLNAPKSTRALGPIYLLRLTHNI